MTTGLLTPPLPESKTAGILDAVFALVQERGLHVGDQLPTIRELADRLSVKPSTVRDALLKAETLGLIKVLPRAGAFLRALPAGTAVSTANDLGSIGQSTLAAGDHNPFHLLDARRLIEIELAERAATHRRLEELLPMRRALDAMLHLPEEASREQHVDLDIRFHSEIGRVAGNPVLGTLQGTLLELLRPFLNSVLPNFQRRESTDGSHIAIYEACVAGDAAKARQEMYDHLSLAYDGLLQTIQQPPAINNSSLGG